jgi:hypothetical protein
MTVKFCHRNVGAKSITTPPVPRVVLKIPKQKISKIQEEEIVLVMKAPQWKPIQIVSESDIPKSQPNPSKKQK